MALTLTPHPPVEPGQGGRPRLGPPANLEHPKNSLLRKMHDPVNSPTHYRQHPSGVECIQITEHFNFCIGNAIKYLWRAGLKSPDPIEDLQKAHWYIEREIARQREKAAKTAQTSQPSR